MATLYSGGVAAFAADDSNLYLLIRESALGVGMQVMSVAKSGGAPTALATIAPYHSGRAIAPSSARAREGSSSRMAPI